MSIRCLFGLHHPVYACGTTIAVTACTRCGAELEPRVRMFRPELERAAKAAEDAFWIEVDAKRHADAFLERCQDVRTLRETTR